MIECCRNCDLHYPEDNPFIIIGDIWTTDCIMCSDSDTELYNPNGKCDYYVKDEIKEGTCRQCMYYKPTPFDEYEGESATIYSCSNLTSNDIYNGTCPKFKLWDGEYNIYDY